MRPHLPLIGRQSDIEEITQRLANPACSLLTIFGSGGSGKTHLAITLANQLVTDFTDGIEFISLQSVNTVNRLASVICEALGVPISGKVESGKQLIQALESVNMLLVLDSYEHLLPEVDLLSGIIANAPDVKLLITSREPLNLRGEWLYPIGGLEFPEDETEIAQRSFDAIELFTSCASRVKPQFDLQKDLQAVVRICKLVHGLPLAIELAASWVQSLTCDEIADEVERNLDFLRTHLHDVPERHRSLRAVFDQTWSVLSSEEQTCFRRLSVFVGGFQREAAEAVTETGWLTLSALCNKMLLQRSEDGRYTLHELLRQYALEKLKEAGEQDSTFKAHGLYYAQFLADRRIPILGGSQHTVTNEIIHEFENISSNLINILLVPEQEIVDRIIYPLNDALQFRNRYQDALCVFEQAVEILKDNISIATYEALTMLGWINVRFGKSRQAKEFATKALELWKERAISPLPGFASDAHTLMSIVSMIQGDYADALKWAEQALQEANSRKDEPNQAMAYYNLCDAHLACKEYDLAYFHIQQAVTICRRLGDQWFMAYCLNHLGHLMRIQGDYVAARQHYQESYRIRETYDDAEGMAIALTNLGYIALLQERYEEAQSMLKRSHDLYQTIDDNGGTVFVLYLLGESSLAFGDIDIACDYLLDALLLTQEIESVPRTLAVISRIGSLALATGLTDMSASLLHFVAVHPHSEPDTVEQAQLQLKRLRAILNAEAYHQAHEWSQTLTLESMVRESQKLILQARMQPAKARVKAKVQHSQQQNLVEPLSQREMEILQLLVEGLTNQEIAERLIVAEGTVKTHTHNIFSKLDVRNRLRATIRARELGLVE